MKTFKLSLLAAVLAVLGLTSCYHDDGPSSKDEAFVAILKNRNIDYWNQVACGFSEECISRGIIPIVYFTEDEVQSSAQTDIVKALKTSKYNIKGIAFAPIWTESDRTAEQAVADFAQEKGIPVVVVDSPIDERTSPLKSVLRSYVGTDNFKAGRDMAGKVTAKPENILVVRDISSTPTTQRYEGICDAKGKVDLWSTGSSEIGNISRELARKRYTDIIFLNGHLCKDVLADLSDYNVYTFDLYKEYHLQAMSDTFLKGVMAQNTISMGRQCVSDLIAAPDSKDHFIPAAYICPETVKIPSEDIMTMLNYINHHFDFIAALIGPKANRYNQLMGNILTTAAMKNAEALNLYMPTGFADETYQENALEYLSTLSDTRIKGAIMLPLGAKAEQAAANLAESHNIPFVIIDSPLSSGSPLEPYIKTSILTDNSKEGVNLYKEAEATTAGRILVLGKTNSAASKIRFDAVKEYAGSKASYYTMGGDETDVLSNIKGILESEDIRAVVCLNGSHVNELDLQYYKAHNIGLYVFDRTDVTSAGLENGAVKCLYEQNAEEICTRAVEIITKNEKVDKTLYIPVKKFYSAKN